MRTLLLEQRKNSLYNLHTKAQAEKSNKPYTVPQFTYVVKQLVNSTEPAVGTTVSKPDVDRYCGSPVWKVTIKGKK
jgi:hypothetical protein